jgi:hypothetical protein
MFFIGVKDKGDKGIRCAGPVFMPNKKQSVWRNPGFCVPRNTKKSEEHSALRFHG